MTDAQDDYVLTGYDEPYNSETSDGVMLNNLFSKWGFADGDDPRADGIHKAFSEHLQKHGYENEVIGSVHNRRVNRIKLEGKWYATELLIWGNDWTLIEQNGDETWTDDSPTIPVPESLKRVILDFLPVGWEMMHSRNLK